MTSNDIALWMRKFDFDALLLWLQTSAIHPNNQLYQIRFEYLIACLLSIEPESFGNQPLTHREFKKFLLSFFQKTSHDFYISEDFSPYSQLKMIPYFYNGHKYYFFYGNLERPWEFINKLDIMYLKPQYQVAGNLEEAFILSLSFQTNLLTRITANNESLITTKSLYIPTEQYLNSFKDAFVCNEIFTHSLMSPIAQGDFSLNMADNKKTSTCGMFDSLVVESSGRRFFLLPQLHIEMLFKIFDKSLFDSQFSKPNLQKTNDIIKDELLKRSAACFGRHSIVRVVDVQNKSLLLNNEITVRIAENQILLFHILRVRHQTAFNMESGISIVKSRISNIREQSFLGIHADEEDDTFIPPEVLNFNGIIIFQHTGISAMPFGVNDLSIPFFSFDDIIRIFTILDNPMDFLNYINEHLTLHQKTKVFLVDQIDEFAAYITNGKTFLEAGRYPDLFCVETHSWHDYFSEYLFEKYSSNMQIYEFSETFRPYYFDYIHKTADGVYEVFNKTELSGGTVILLKNKTYFISSVITGNENDLKISEKFLNPLFCEYLVKLNEALDKKIFIQMFNSMPSIIYLDLIPISVVPHKAFSFLQEELDAFNSNNPIHITVRWRRTGEPHIFVLYDSLNMTSLFSDEMNTGERSLIHKLVVALLKYFINHVGADVDTIATHFIDTYIPSRTRRFGVEAVDVNNPRLVDYQNYIKTTETNLSVVKIMVAESIASLNYTSGTHLGVKAKEIVENIYHILQSRLETLISTFNHHFLSYAYKQLEYVEGAKENAKKKAEIDLRTNTDFDAIASYTEKSNDISLYGLAIKHILSTALKSPAVGTNSITSVEWMKFLALGQLIIEMTQSYDFFEYQLTDFSINISDMYEIQQVSHETIFDSQKYAYEVNHDLLSIHIDDAGPSNSNHKEASMVLIDNAFKIAYGFTFKDMLTILSAMGINDFEHTNDYPLNVMNSDQLCHQLNEWYPSFELKTIHQIIIFLSLTFTTYGVNSNMIPSFLMRKKERLNLCPLIAVSNDIIWGNQLCIGASRFWSGVVGSGDFPYSIDCPKEITKAIKEIHRNKDKELEAELAQIARNVIGQNYVIAPVLKFDSIHSDLPRYPDCGEIDLLVAFSSSKKIIIGEAKNRNRRSRAYDMQLEHRDFFAEDTGYYSKLKKKLKFVEKNLLLFLDYFKIIDKEGWSIESAFLVNKVYSSAFLGYDIEFVLKDKFHQYLLDKASSN